MGIDFIAYRIYNMHIVCIRYAYETCELYRLLYRRSDNMIFEGGTRLMSEKKATKKRLCITLDEEIYQKLKDIAEFDHTTMSQWVTDRVIEAVRSTEYQELTFR